MKPTTPLKNLINLLFIEFIHKMKKKKQKQEIISPRIIKLLTEKNLKFEDIFKTPEHLDYITSIFIERKLINPETGRWMDFGKGYKTVMIGYLKYFHDLGFLKNNQKLNHRQIQAVCLNSFGVEIGIDLIKHINSKNVLIPNIPLLTYLYTIEIAINVLDAIF